jgi:translation elongation factor EF-Tu-like GTPase
MSKSNDLMINIIRDAITGGNVITGELESGEIHADLVKEIEKILFTKKALSKALNNCKKDLTSLGKELGCLLREYQSGSKVRLLKMVEVFLPKEFLI